MAPVRSSLVPVGTVMERWVLLASNQRSPITSSDGFIDTSARAELGLTSPQQRARQAAQCACEP
jgi:hypothetical protein